MDLWPSHTYRKLAANNKTEPSIAANALEQAHQAQRNGFPAILTLGHLSWYTDVSVSYLRSVVSRRHDPYRVFQIRKRSGGVRNICSPDPLLLNIQRWMNKYILQHSKPHPASFAYTQGGSSIKCAEQHVQCNWLIKIDIQQFFESISEIQVYRVFREFGYSHLPAFELARLTTRVVNSQRRYRCKQWNNIGVESYSLFAYRYPHIGHLPQGAPTSPVLANLCMRKLDEIFSQIANASSLTYTRYSDDMVFSTSERHFNRTKAKDLINEVYSHLKAFGLRPSTAKTTISPPGSKKVVLGLLVDTAKPRLQKIFRERIEQHIHYANKFSPENHARRRGFESILGFKNHLYGLINYAIQVDYELGNNYREKADRLSWPL